ncbi:TonB-dependent receptor [bacterium]|nr:TonB-dependent receptor [bacterium]
MRGSNIFLVLLLILTGFLILPLLAQDTRDFENMSLEELLQVKVVTATKRPLKIAEAPSIVRVITAREIAQRGYGSVGEALQSVPGLYLINDHLNYNIGVRGVSGGLRGWNQVVRVLIDDQPVVFKSNNTNFLGYELIPITAVERIEVVLGPGSTLYGPNSYLGVVNIITKSGEKVDNGILSISTGTQNGANSSYGGDIVLGKNIQFVDFMFTASSYYLDESGLRVPSISPLYNNYKFIESRNDINEPTSFYGRLAFNHEKLGKLILNGNYLNFNDHAEFQDWGILTHQNQVALSNYNAFVKYQNEIQKTLSFYLKYGISEGKPAEDDHLEIENELFWIKRDFNYQSNEIACQLEYYPTREISLSLGSDYIIDKHRKPTFWSVYKQDYENYNAGDSIAMFGENGDTTFKCFGLYTQVIYKPTDNLSLTEGLIYNNHDVYGDFFNTRMGIVHEFYDRGYWKLLYGTSFKVPSVMQLFTTPMYPGGVIGNPELEPEKTKTFDFEFSPVNTQELMVSTNAFYNMVDKKIQFIHDGAYTKSYNMNNIRAYGAEAEIRWFFNNFTCYWNFAYQQSHFKLDLPEDADDNLYADQKRTFQYPNVTSNTVINYAVPQLFLNLNLEHRYVGSRYSSQQNVALNGGLFYEVPAYQVFNFTISTVGINWIPLGETILSLSIKNFTDVEYVEPGYSGIDIPGSPRSLVLKLTKEF